MEAYLLSKAIVFKTHFLFNYFCYFQPRFAIYESNELHLLSQWRSVNILPALGLAIYESLCGKTEKTAQDDGLLTPKDAGWLLIAQKLKSRRAVSLQEIVIFSKDSYVKL